MDDQIVDRESSGSVRGTQFALIWLFFALLVGGAVWFGARTFAVPAGSVDETKRRGDVVIQALNNFHADHGRFPRSLAELSPQYLEEIPEPDWGLRRWLYEPDGSDFYLRVNETEHTGDGDSHWLRYEGDKSGWRMGD
jgi:hypothetical protein